jgi:hypothetical protein
LIDLTPKISILTRQFFKLIFLYLFIFVTPETVYSRAKDQIYFPNRSEYRNQKQLFLNLSAGFSPYYKSDHKDVLNMRMPLQFQVELASNISPWSALAGCNFFSQYVLNDFRFSPTSGFLGVKRSFLRKANKRLRWSPYIFAGGQYCHTYLTDIEYDEIKSYSFKQETANTFGFISGTGLSYRFNYFDLQLQYQYLFTKAEFIAGYFTKNFYYVGSHQITFMFTPRFQINKRHIKCPAFDSKY